MPNIGWADIGGADEAQDKLCLFLSITGECHEDAVIYQGLMAFLERAKVPDRLIYLDELPRTANQKVDRKALRALLADGRV